MKKSLQKGWHVCTVLWLLVLNSYGQMQVTGTVTDGKDQTQLVGVSVVVKGTTRGTLTDVNGKYVIETNEKATLVFSYTGYDRREFAVGNQSVINVELTMADNVLNEVVVVGYGTQKEKEVTGAVGSVKGDMLIKSPVADLGAAIQGQVAGVNVQAASGRPGEASNVQIRGLGSLSTGRWNLCT